MGSGVATAPMHLPCTSHASHRSLLFPTISTHYTTYYLLLRSLLFPTVLQQTHTEIAPSSVLWISRWVSVLLLGTYCRTAHSVLARGRPRALATGRRGVGSGCGCGWGWLACSRPSLLAHPGGTAATLSNPNPKPLTLQVLLLPRLPAAHAPTHLRGL